MFWDNYVELCNREKKSPNTVARELEISSGSVTGWKQGRIPNTPILKKIANHFNVTVDELVTSLDFNPFDVKPSEEIKQSKSVGTWNETNIQINQKKSNDDKTYTYIAEYELETDDNKKIILSAEFIPADNDGYDHLAYLFSYANKKRLPLEVQYTISYAKYNYRLKFNNNGITLFATIKPKNITQSDIMNSIEEYLRKKGQL